MPLRRTIFAFVMRRRVRVGSGRRIGLLGGSFNPAHDGHLHLSREALRRLKLDAVWWLVTPQNPLKPVFGMAPLAARLAQARRIAQHPRIIVTDLEAELGTFYTADTLPALQRLLPDIQFVWLMGADNLIQINHWEAWQSIFATMPIAVFARPAYSVPALASVAARQFKPYRLPERAARRLAEAKPPVWVFLHMRLHPASATAIRRALQNIRRGTGEEKQLAPAESALKESMIDQQNLTLAIAASPAPSNETEMNEREATGRVAQFLVVALASLDDDKAEHVVTIDLRGKSNIADFMVIASGRSGRQVAAMAEHLREKLKHAGVRQLSVEGLPRGDWVLIDARDIIVQLFRPEVRAFYNLEKMWGVDVPAERVAPLDPLDDTEPDPETLSVIDIA